MLVWYEDCLFGIRDCLFDIRGLLIRYDRMAAWNAARRSTVKLMKKRPICARSALPRELE